MNENIKEIQEVIMKQIKRLDGLDVLDIDKCQEIYRANAITQSAVAYVKTVNLQIRIEEMKNKDIKI